MVFKALRLIQRRLLFCHCHTAVYGQQLGAYRLHQFSISIAHILLGFGDNTYGPTKPVTREQLAAILYRYAQFKEYPTSIPSTTDLGREDVSRGLLNTWLGPWRMGFSCRMKRDLAEDRRQPSAGKLPRR